MDLKMTAPEVERLITTGFERERAWFQIEALSPGALQLRAPFRKSMLRPGNVISGPALFAVADVAMYALLLAHVGPAVMAVTADLNIRFLNRGSPQDVLADASLLKLGAKLAVMEVRLRCGVEPAVVAHVTGSYSIPANDVSSAGA